MFHTYFAAKKEKWGTIILVDRLSILLLVNEKETLSNYLMLLESIWLELRI